MVEYKLILEMARHGARAPSVMYNFTAWGQKNFPEPMELTQLGADQHYSTGEYVRQTYFNNTAPKTMKDAKIYAQSTDTNRTKQSATSQLQGVFGSDLSFPDLDQDDYPLMTDVDGDKLILTEGSNCKRFQQIEDDVEFSDEWTTLFNEKLGENLLEPNVYNWLISVTKLNRTLYEESDIATYVWDAHYHDMKLRFDVSDEHQKWCQVASDQFTYKSFAATPEYWYLATQRQLTLLTELVNVVFDGAEPAEDSIIYENLYADGSMYSEGEMPYFWLLLGHQETLWPLTAALGLTRAAKLPFASAYFFEFLTEDGSDYVATKFRDDKGNVSDVELACSTAEKKACEKSAFLSFIGERLTLAQTVDCDTDYPSGEHTYADTDVYLAQLLKDIGVNQDDSSFIQQ